MYYQKKKELRTGLIIFQQLLGNPPTVTYEDEEIPIVFEQLPIGTDAFDSEEYEKAKKNS